MVDKLQLNLVVSKHRNMKISIHSLINFKFVMEWNNLEFTKFIISKSANFELYLFDAWWYYHRWKSVNDVAETYRGSSMYDYL